MDYLQTGQICYFNLDTLEFEFFIKEAIFDPDEYEAMTGEKLDDTMLKHHSWKRSIEIESMKPHESFKTMEYFVD